MARMMDRELSALAFHARVLAEATAPENPLMERANFLGIAASGLEEFITVRLGSLAAKLRKVGDGRPSGERASQTLEEAWNRVNQLTVQLDKILHEEILPPLEREGIFLVAPENVTEAQQSALAQRLADDMPPLAPMTEGRLPDSGRTCLLVEQTGVEPGSSELSVVELPPSLPALIPLEGKGLLLAEDAVKMNLQAVFPEREIKACHAFRVLRDAHASCKEKEPDLRKAVRKCLKKRAKGRVLRIICAPDMPDHLRARLCGLLDADESAAVTGGAVLNPAAVMREITGMEGRDYMRYQPFAPHRDALLTGDLFAAVRAQDHLLCHPYDSFQPVIDLMGQAAADPDVTAISMTLYRVSEQSPMVAALMQAAQRGAAVTVCVEPRARMDEARNLRLMDMLEAAGCRVVAGMPGAKVHGKALLIERSEGGSVRRYAHFGTGNYNEVTAARYTDFGLLTADDTLCADVARFFDSLTAQSKQPELQELTASPDGMRQELLRLIRREMDKAKRGESCGIACLLNALTDRELIGALNDAARCGVPVDLTVRGACRLMPEADSGIRVRSIVGRYLEHGRAFAFGGEGAEEVYFSSADWMKRSLDRRMELLVPVKDPRCRRKLLYCMGLRREADIRCWRLEVDDYTAARCCPGGRLVDVQQRQMMEASSGWSRA